MVYISLTLAAPVNKQACSKQIVIIKILNNHLYLSNKNRTIANNIKNTQTVIHVKEYLPLNIYAQNSADQKSAAGQFALNTECTSFTAELNM